MRDGSTRLKLVWVIVGGAFWIAQPAWGQEQPQEAGAATGAPALLDEFGNVVPRPETRRAVGVVDPASNTSLMGSDLLRQRLFGGQTLVRSSPLDTLAVESPLAGKSTLFNEPGTTAGAPAYPYPPWAIRPGGSMRTWLLQRRQTMFMRTPSANVARATGVTGAMRMGAWGTVTGEAPVQNPDAAEMEQQLLRANQDAHARAISTAWSLTRAGQYRQASRMFRAAAVLDAEDLDARIGEVFCEFQVGAIGTAQVVLGELTRRFENPFVSSLNLADGLATAAAGGDLRSRLRLQVQTQRGPEALALYTFLLWYAGEREEAMRAAERPAVTEAELFRDWAAKMRQAVD